MMARPDTHAELERLAEQCVAEKDPAEAERILGELLFEHCAPLIKGIAGARLRGSPGMTQDLEDVCADALIELVAKVEDLRSGAAESVQSFSSYTAVVAYHACHDYFRRKFPQRHRLKNRLRYLLKLERGFEVWEGARGDWICGYAKWREAGTRQANLAGAPDGAGHMSPPELLAAIFKGAGGPVEFDALVDLVAELWNVRDETMGPQLVESLPAPAQLEADNNLCTRLQELWKQIGELPRAQRLALLLNLRAEDEKCALELFPLTGVASIREIAALLEIPAQEFAELWNRLPLDDLAIAERLQVTRQQVINLRKSARKRLERRMAVIRIRESTSFMIKTIVCLCRI
jgi:RNA polymerase sigma factor (sigma-70 family)